MNVEQMLKEIQAIMKRVHVMQSELRNAEGQVSIDIRRSLQKAFIELEAAETEILGVFTG